MKNLMPNSNPQKFINQETGDISKLLYLAGSPRNYHLDLSKGFLNLNGITPVTESKKEFQVIPLAIRTLEADLFKQGEKKWCEFYFLNEEGHVCCFMFHRYSLDNFREQFKALYYDEIAPTDAKWTIGYEEKQNADKQKYFIATFKYEMLSAEDIETMKILRNEIKQKDTYIFRGDTQLIPSTYKIHYSSPVEPTDEDLKLEAKKENPVLDETPISKTTTKTEVKTPPTKAKKNNTKTKELV